MTGLLRALFAFALLAMAAEPDAAGDEPDAAPPPETPVPDDLPVWERYPGDDVVLLSRDLSYTLEEDGAVSFQVSLAYQSASEKGRESLQSRTIDYNAAIHQVEVLRACSILDSGEERCTAVDTLIRQPEAGAEIVPGQNEPTEIVVPFDEVRLGSRIELVYRRDYPAREGQRLFSAIRVRSGTGPTAQMSVSVTHTQARPVQGRLVGDGEYTRSEVDGRTVHRWSFGAQPSSPKDSDRPTLTEIGPALYLSEFDDWQSFVDWYMPYVDAAAERYRKSGGREVMALAEPRMSRLDPALKLGFLMDDRTPAASVDLTVGSLLPGEMETVVRHAPTQVEKSIALRALLQDAGVQGVHLALTTRYRLGIPGDIACPPAFQDMIVYVEGRGVLDGDTHADFVDTVPGFLRSGTVVILDPSGPRVLSGDEMNPAEALPGRHRDGRITLSGDEVRVEEDLTFSGSAEAVVRSNWRRKQDALDNDRQADRKVAAKRAARFAKPADETYVEEETKQWVRSEGYASGRVRGAELFDAWDVESPVNMHLRYAPESTCVHVYRNGRCAERVSLREQVGDLLMVRLPLEIDGISGRCATGRTERDAPLSTTPWTYTYRYDFVVPEGYELVGVPEDVELENDLASLSLTFTEAEIPPLPPDEDDKKKADDDEEPEGPRPGVVVEASYRIHVQRVPEDRYAEFHTIAARHALAFSDPIVLRKATSSP